LWSSLALPSDWDAITAANSITAANADIEGGNISALSDSKKKRDSSHRDNDGAGKSSGDSEEDDADSFPVDEDDFFFSDDIDRGMGGPSASADNGRVSSPSLVHSISSGALKIVTSLSQMANSSSSSQLHPSTPNPESRGENCVAQ
jgi:hypothetical protein